MLWIVAAIVAGLLIAAAAVYYLRHRPELDIPEPAPRWFRLDAHCLRCESPWVKRMSENPPQVGDAVECSACGSVGKVTKV